MYPRKDASVTDSLSNCRAIKYVGGIIEDHDTDKKFPAMGFGAKVPEFGLSHNFPMNLKLNPLKPGCEGVDGILEAYYTSLNTVTFSGPTHLAPLINQVSLSARSQRNMKPTYHVLLIITVRTCQFILIRKYSLKRKYSSLVAGRQS